MTALAPLEIPPGTDVRGFLIEGKLGAGGFGTVYRARRGERLYALKFIRRKDAGGWAKREVDVLMRLAHPNVVGFEGCGFWPDDTREYLVIIMVLVEGRRLDVWADEENPDARQVSQKVLGVGKALAAIHRENVVHRDLKEANIIVGSSDGEPVVVDFGVAGGPDTPRVTRDVLPPCTLEYRSPEAWRFLRENVGRLDVHYQPGPADDLYALGVVLYWLVTSRYPCVGATEAEQADATLHHVPEPPHIVNPRVPEAISAICMRLLEKLPENRYPDAGALGLALEAELARADGAWGVPLCDAHAPDNLTTVGKLAREDGDDGVDHWLREARHKHERPRRGKRPAAPAAQKGKPPSPGVEVPRVPPAPPVEPPAAALSIPLLGAVALVLALGLAVAVAQLHPRPATSPSAAGGTTWEVGWKVASPRKSPESDQVAAPLEAEPTPVTVASRATPSKDMPSVKNPQQKQLQGLGPVGKMIGTGAACITMTMACTGPQVRPEPPAEPCPSGAVQSMAELGIGIGDDNDAAFLSGPTAEVIPVREGWTRVELGGRWGGLPAGTILKGRLLFGGDRVYGRFTEAQNAEGSRTWLICMEVLNTSKDRGLKLKPGSTAETAKVFNSVVVKAVDRFQ
jgi:predicted Ser/Thr protein kinase